MDARRACWAAVHSVAAVPAGHSGDARLGRLATARARHLPHRHRRLPDGRAGLADGTQLYNDATLFQTQAGLDLPFTYPPLAAVAFSPFAWLSLPAASAAITLTTLVLLIVSTHIVLTRLQVWQHSSLRAPGLGATRLAGRRPGGACGGLRRSSIRANFEFGQINVVLMTLVIADCVPRTHAVATRSAAGTGHRSEADPGGLPAVLPAAPRCARAAGHHGLGGGGHLARVRTGLA